MNTPKNYTFKFNEISKNKTGHVIKKETVECTQKEANEFKALYKAQIIRVK